MLKKMSLETIIGIGASIFTATSLIPQLVKVAKEKKADNISAGMLLVLFGGLTLWIVYGFLKNDLIILLSNSFSFLVNVALTVLALKFKRRA